MTRIFLTYILPLLLPTLVYFAWAWLMRHKTGKGKDWWQEGPWFWLTIAGFGVLVVVLAITAATGGGKPGQEYIPPRMEDGRIVPGEFR